MAELYTHLALDEMNVLSYQDERLYSVDRTLAISTELSDVEIWPETSGSVYDSPLVPCIYHCGVIAVELLASHVGLRALTDYYTRPKHTQPVSYTHLTLPTICSV